MFDISDLAGRPSGHFVLDVFRDGVQVDRVDEPNLVVDLSKTALSRLLGGDVTNRSVTTIGFGTNGTAPVAGNTELTGAFSKAIDSVSYPSANSVMFSFSLASGENNGMAIMEFGLLTAGGALFARKVRASALNKGSDISLSGTWTITF